MIILKHKNQIDSIRDSCKIVAHVLREIEKLMVPGITTSYLDAVSEDLCYSKGGIPGFKGYKGFPYSICASKNNTVVHGFPDNVPLIDGDILSIDFGVLYKGWYGDSAFTKAIGNVDVTISKLISTGEECLYKGIQSINCNSRIGDVSNSIQTHAESNGFSVVTGFVGHGIGMNLHEKPQVPNVGNKHTGVMIKPGTVIAIEPMINMGTPNVYTSENNWSVLTEDNNLSVHFEHTVAYNGKYVEVLTDRNK